MDDETYVLADFAQLPFYVAGSRGNVDEEFRTSRNFPRNSSFAKQYVLAGKGVNFS